MSKSGAVPAHMKRNVFLLATCQALFNTSTGVLLAIAALVGYKLAVDKSVATLPQAIQWLSTAAFAIPVARVGGFRRCPDIVCILSCLLPPL